MIERVTSDDLDESGASAWALQVSLQRRRMMRALILGFVLLGLSVGALMAVLVGDAVDRNRRAAVAVGHRVEAVVKTLTNETETSALSFVQGLGVGNADAMIAQRDPTAALARRQGVIAMRLIGGEDRGWLSFDPIAPDFDPGPMVASLAPGTTMTLGFLDPGSGEPQRLIVAAKTAARTTAKGSEPILVVARAISADDWRRWGQASDIDELHFVSGVAASGWPIRGVDASRVGTLSWRDPAPGWQGLSRLTAPVFFIILILGAVAAIWGRQSARVLAGLESGGRRLEAANRELEQSRQCYCDFAQSASDWFWETGPDYRYTRVSERVALIIGDEPAAVFGQSLLDLGRLVDDPSVWAGYRADILAGRAFRDLEVTWVNEAEKTFFFRIGGRPVLGADGGLLGYRGTGVDVTVETLALIEARFMQEVVQDSLDSISEAFVLFGADGRLLFCNDPYRKAYPDLADILLPGVTFSEILRIAAERSNIVEAQENIGTWIQERIERHLGKSAADDHLLSNGHWYRISEHETPSGGVVKVLTDITELKEREQELASQIAKSVESEKRYRQLFELAPYGIVIWDGDAVRFSNTAATSIFGLGNQGPLEGRRLADLFEDGAVLESDLIEAAEGRTQRVSTMGIRADGQRRDMEVGAYPAVFQKEPTVLLVIEDVTDRKRVAEELQRSQKMEAIGRMAGGVAHEFNNMLTAIGGFARLAERAPDDSDRVLLCVREIAKASDRAAALTGQLLDFSRRRVTEESEVVAVTDLIEDLRVFLKPLMSSGVSVAIDIREPGVCALANPVTLTQAVLNLVINARDAMAEGGEITIRLDRLLPDAAFFRRHDALKVGRYVAISVADTGSGIPEAIRDRIWEPFFTTKELGKGTGLGLSMVYSTAQAAGGVVEFVTELKVGTTFTIYLPEANAQVPLDGDGEVPRFADGQTYAILLVDDEDSVRRFLALALGEAGCVVTEASDGVEAVEKFDAAGGLFDAVVTDVSMPRMNGAELAKALSERNPYLRMLFLTGYASREQADGLTDREFWRLLMKPVTPEKLIRALRELLSAGSDDANLWE